MKRTSKKKLQLPKETVRVMGQELDRKALQAVVGAGSLINCQTRNPDGDDDC